jgi:nucleoside-diphosphate-sugar epimerase
MAKIAITGHTAGIGQAFAKIYEEQGHEVIGLSRRNGYNIRNIPKLLGQIEPCDMLINNAQVGFAQTELLFSVYELWQGKPNKKIINISTLMTSEPSSCLEGFGMLRYHVEKTTLEEAIRQLRANHNWPKLCLVKPGKINTQGDGGINVDAWAKRIVSVLDCEPYMQVEEIAIGEHWG